MTRSSDERALAMALAALSDHELAEVLANRDVPAASAVNDFFDLADALLDGNAIARLLPRLSAEQIRALESEAGEHQEELRALALTDADGIAYPSIREHLRTVRCGTGSTSDAVPPREATDLESRTAAERAFGAVNALADLLLWTQNRGLARTSGGSPAASDRRRLIDAGLVADAQELEQLVTLGILAGLLAEEAQEWLPTTKADEWLRSSTTHRWQQGADAFAAALPVGIRRPDGGYLAPSSWLAAYPLDREWPARVAVLIGCAERWGLVLAGDAEPAWARPLREKGMADAGALAPHLPPEIDRVWIQADLSVIAPGPLLPSLDLRLRTMARRESRAQASSYRFSGESLTEAVAGGETAQSLREFLSTLSLTGIPQPLDYLIDEVTRHARVVWVSADASRGLTRVTSDDAHLLAQIAVDSSVRPVGLVEDGDGLVSRAARDTVFWTLIDAHYAAIVVDEQGRSLPVQRHLASPVPVADAPVSERYASLIARLRANQGPGSEAAWVERELDMAVRLRETISVEVELPDGTARTFTIEATGIGGGRLRGRDRAGDVERTLPLASIRRIG